ncbi:MAG: thiamine ABC transporter substrate-binding protein [Bdellovibrionaceae bacterium]|nr:thiamine ABC transporter substrate-binding protein [Pseudobdellovibrionaceae bacterium]
MSRRSASLLLLSAGFSAMLGLAFYFLTADRNSVANSGGVVTSDEPLRVLAYSSFLHSWGPGPEIAKRFEQRTGRRVELRDADDAGLILKKLDIFPSDVVIGLDQLLLAEARNARAWKTIPAEGVRFYDAPFLPFDWGPLAFVYREGEVSPPQSLDDLLAERFRGELALQDPRLSSPGLQFLYWVLDQKGQEAGFEFLRRLRSQVHTLGPSWSTTYGVFQAGQARLAFSYLTSPIYHWTQENDRRYQAAVFADGHPVQVEYVGVPESCRMCDEAVRFARFLLEPEIQALLMSKNFMLPIRDEVRAGTEFARLPDAKVYEFRELAKWIRERDALLERWRELGW